MSISIITNFITNKYKIPTFVTSSFYIRSFNSRNSDFRITSMKTIIKKLIYIIIFSIFIPLSKINSFKRNIFTIVFKVFTKSNNKIIKIISKSSYNSTTRINKIATIFNSIIFLIISINTTNAIISNKNN